MSGGGSGDACESAADISKAPRAAFAIAPGCGLPERGGTLGAGEAVADWVDIACFIGAVGAAGATEAATGCGDADLERAAASERNGVA